MADVEATLRSVVQPILLPGEQVLGVSSAPEEPSRLWTMATGIGFILGILPGLLVALFLLARHFDPPYIVATNRRLFLFKGRVSMGFVKGERVVDLGTVGRVEELPNGNVKKLALHFRNGGKLSFTGVTRDASRGLSAATKAGFFDGFAGWLSGTLPQLQAQAPLDKAQLTPPNSGAVKALGLFSKVGWGLVVLVVLGLLVKQLVINPMAEASQDEEARARMVVMDAQRNTARVEAWRAIGATPEAQQWLAALASKEGFSSPFIGVQVTPPPAAETQAVDQAGAAAARSSDQVGRFGSATVRWLGFSGEESIQHRFTRALHEDLSMPPIRVLNNPNGDGRVSVAISVRPAGRVHRFGGSSVCPLFDTTATITAVVTGGAPLTRVVEVPAPTDEALRSDYWQRIPTPSRCMEQQGGEVGNVVVGAIGDLFVGAGVGHQ